jgi:hypothetical protein
MLLTQEQVTEINERLVQPAYIRLPKWGERCPFTGLTRSALDLLTRAQPGNNFRPPVRSKLFKQTGQKSGIKLIDYRSLRIFLDGLPDGSKVVNPRRKDQTREERGAAE